MNQTESGIAGRLVESVSPRSTCCAALSWSSWRSTMYGTWSLIRKAQTILAAVDFTGSAGGWFFTRWVTHICAPTFVLLAGVSAFLYGAMRQRSTGEVARFLVSRGVWLVFIELTVVNFAWTFNLRATPILQVIWAIGCSMIALSGLIWLPRIAIAAVGVVMIVAHNGLDRVQPLLSEASPAWVLLHISGPLTVSGTPVALVVYPLIPWIGVMALGYAIGAILCGPQPCAAQAAHAHRHAPDPRLLLPSDGESLWRAGRLGSASEYDCDAHQLLQCHQVPSVPGSSCS